MAKKQSGGVSKVKGGYKVRRPSGGYFSKKPQSHKKALAQLRAVEFFKHGGKH